MLQGAFDRIVECFEPQVVQYSNTNPLIAESDGEHGEDVQWKVSSYMDLDRANEGARQREVQVNLELRDACQELLQHCDDLFTPWYERIHGAGSVHTLTRMQSFVTRYRARPNENALLRHIDGALVDGSVILALPTGVPFEGGGVTVWDGKPEVAHTFASNPGDVVLLDNFVWHQGNPISTGERWALVIFYSVKEVVQGKRLYQVMNRCLRNGGAGECDANTLEAQRQRIRTKVLWTVPWFAVQSIVEAAELTPGDTVMELGVADGALLLAAAAKQQVNCIGVGLGEASIESVDALAAQEGLSHAVRLIELPLFSLAQELVIEGATVLFVHFNKSFSSAISPVLGAVKHQLRVLAYGEPLAPEWVPERKVTVTCENPQTPQEKYTRATLYVYKFPQIPSK